MLEKISKKPCEYQSPTDMGVNCIKAGIIDDEETCEAARLEIARRYFQCRADFILGRTQESTMNRIVEIIGKAGIAPEKRDVVVAARKAAADAQKQGKEARDLLRRATEAA